MPTPFILDPVYEHGEFNRRKLRFATMQVGSLVGVGCAVFFAAFFGVMFAVITLFPIVALVSEWQLAYEINLAGQQVNLLLLGGFLVGSLITGRFTMQYANYIRRYYLATGRYQRLKTYGVLLNGEIGECRRKGNSPANFEVVIRYKFNSPQGQILIGQQEVMRFDLKDKSLPPVGTPVRVLYADDHAYVML